MSMSSPSPVERDIWIDWGKALASQLIVWHHLLIYGPMGRNATPAAQGLWDWLADEARMAVQIFLVMGGYLAARALLQPWGQAPKPLRTSAWHSWGRAVRLRYQRLMGLGALAVGVAVLAAAWTRDILPDPDTPEAPSGWQLLANVGLLHDLLGWDSVNAGLWYVAIDWQLFACLAALACWQRSGGRPWHRSVAAWGVIAGGVAALFWANLQPGWDVVAPYFWGSYALGVVAFWLRHAPPAVRQTGVILLVATLMLALMWAWRERLVWAGVTAGVLIFQPGARWLARSAWQPLMRWLADISYPVFLFHYSVCMVCGAWIGRMWPGDVTIHTLGLLGTWGLCLLVGWAVTEGEGRWHRARQARMARTAQTCASLAQ